MFFMKKKETSFQIAEKITAHFQTEMDKAETLPSAMERFERLFALEKNVQIRIREQNAESVKRGNVAAAVVGGVAGISGGGAGAVFAADAAQKFADASFRKKSEPVTLALNSLAQALSQKQRNLISEIPLVEFQKSSNFIKFTQRFPELLAAGNLNMNTALRFEQTPKVR